MSEKLRIGDAGAKGMGVFAVARIGPGELVWDYQGEEQWISEIPEELWQYSFQVDYDRYVVPERRSVGWYLNHSCNPTCVVTGRTRIIALSTIEPGDEVTFDYSTNVGWDGFTMKCECGSPRCRRVVRSYGYLSQDLKERYGALVSRFLIEKRAAPKT